MGIEITFTDAGGATISGIIKCGDGILMPSFDYGAEQTLKNIESLPDLPIRDDDIMLHTYPKSGTTWGFEILSMLLRGSAERQPTQKIDTMLERVKPEVVESMSSPRILNTHVPLQFLPKQLEQKKTKILLIMRNPKDVAVSMYHMIRGVNKFNYDGVFKDFLVNYMNGNLQYGSWFDYALGWEKAIESGKYNVHMAFFEDLKEDGLEEIKKIAKFLDVKADDELCQAICEACSFERMKVGKAQPKAVAEKFFRPGFTFFRKGQIGDWKNYFTVAESEAFDELFENKMESTTMKSKFKFVSSN